MGGNNGGEQYPQAGPLQGQNGAFSEIGRRRCILYRQNVIFLSVLEAQYAWAFSASNQCIYDELLLVMQSYQCNYCLIRTMKFILTLTFYVQSYIQPQPKCIIQSEYIADLLQPPFTSNEHLMNIQFIDEAAHELDNNLPALKINCSGGYDVRLVPYLRSLSATLGYLKYNGVTNDASD